MFGIDGSAIFTSNNNKVVGPLLGGHLDPSVPIPLDSYAANSGTYAPQEGKEVAKSLVGASDDAIVELVIQVIDVRFPAIQF